MDLDFLILLKVFLISPMPLVLLSIRHSGLWFTDGSTIYLSVEDQYDGQRLLVHRQMVDLSGSDPELHSELREFSLGPLMGGTVKLDLKPRRAMHEEPAAAVGDDLFSPLGGGPPPISIPD